MDSSSWVLISAILLVVIGLGLSLYAAVRALNSAFSEKEDHALFWTGTILTAIGVIILIFLVFNKMSKINTLTNENYNLYSKISNLQTQLGKCSGSSISSGPSGPSFFSRIGSKIGGWFRRNTSVPAAGNSDEVNRFKSQE